MTTSAITLFNPSEAVQLAISMKQVVIAMSNEVLKENVDFGKIPGTDKNVLLKPGAERLCSAFKLAPVFEPVSQVEDFERGFFFYRYSCALVHRETGEVYGRGIGSCNSQENKYGYRWVSTPPAHLDPSTLMTRSGMVREPKFAIDKGETGGKYGKPAEYWQAFRDAIANGTARKVPDQKTKAGQPMEVWEIGGLEYRIPNPDVFDLVNTIDKMAQKRALIAATLIAVNASEFFTQDMEDFAHDLPKPSVIIEGEFEDVTPAPKAVSRPSQPATSAPAKTPASAPAETKPGPESPADWAANLRLIGWTWDTFRIPKEGLPDILKKAKKDALAKEEAKGAVLAFHCGYDAEKVALVADEKGLSVEAAVFANSLSL